MGIGKRPLRLPEVFSGDIEGTLRAHALVLQQVKQEHILSPGLAEFTAAATISKGAAVSLLNGEIILASAATSIPAIGIALNAAASGSKVRIILGMGLAADLSGLTTNRSVYLGNAGALVFTKPASGFIQGLGFALSATDMFVTISQP